MKITIKTTNSEHPYNAAASVSVGHDDVSVEQMIVLLKQVCVGYGYSPDTVKEMFNETDNE